MCVYLLKIFMYMIFFFEILNCHAQKYLEFHSVVYNNSVLNVAKYGKFMHSFQYMGELALVVNLPVISLSLYANGYSYPDNNFNFGLNIGYLIFNPKMLD